MAFNAPFLNEVNARAKKRKTMTTRASGVKPANATNFGGPKDGRPVLSTTSTTSSPSGITRTGGSPVDLTRTPPNGVNLTQRNKRQKDPAAQIRRAARAALGVSDIRNADAATIRRLKAKGLLPGNAKAAKETRLQTRLAQQSIPTVSSGRRESTRKGSRRRTGLYDAARGAASSSGQTMTRKG